MLKSFNNSYLFKFLFLSVFWLTNLFSASFSQTIELQPGTRFYTLNHQMLVIDSVKWTNPADTVRWTSDAVRGRFILLGNNFSAQTIDLVYHASQLKVPLSYSLGLANNARRNKEERRFINRTEVKAVQESALKARGNILRSIQVSSNNQSALSSGMNISLSGNLNENIGITGTISDNSTPFDAYSSTQSLRDIDRIYMELKSENSRSQIGDIQYKSDWGQWSRYTRHLMGISSEYRGKTVTVQGFAGSSKGKFNRQKLITQDGNQGPYRLFAAANQSTSIHIVPGSESAYFNGRILDSKEFIIYYQDAEISFSPTLLIDRESRIYVEFKYQDDMYPQSAVGAYAEKISETINVSFSLISESEDESHPIDPTLQLIPRDSLKMLESGYVSTALPDSNGNYSFDGTVWHYTGSNQGTYFVYFYRENSSGGYIRQYDEKGLLFYLYEPENSNSNYFPRKQITLPTRLDLSSVKLSYSPAENISVEFEAAASQFTPNTFYSTQRFASGSLAGNISYHHTEHPEKFTFNSKAWARNEHFQTFNPIFQPKFLQETALSPLDTVAVFLENSMSVKNKYFDMSAETIHLKTHSDSIRNKIGVRASIHKFIPVTFSYNQLFDTDILPYYDYYLRTRFTIYKNLVLESSFSKEEHNPLSPGVLARSGQSFSNKLSWNSVTELEFISRDDYEWLGSYFKKYSDKSDIKIKLHLIKNKKFKLRSTLTYRNDLRKESEENYILTQNRLSLSLPKWGLRSNLNTTINRNSEAKRDALFIYVGDGLGNYRWNSQYNEYEPDILGDHILRYELSNEHIDQTIHKTFINANWTKNIQKPFPLKMNVSNNTALEYKSPDVILYKRISISQADSLLQYGLTKMKNQIKFQSPGGKKTFSILSESQHIQNTADLYNQRLHYKQKFKTLYKQNLSGKILQIFYEKSYESREKLNSTLYNIQVDKTILGGKIEARLFQTLQYTFQLENQSIQTQFDDTFSSGLIRMTQNIVWNRKLGEQLYISTIYDKLSSDYEKSIPYEVASGLPQGESLYLSLRYEKRLNDGISVNTFAQYRQRAGSSPITLIKMEVKAYF